MAPACALDPILTDAVSSVDAASASGQRALGRRFLLARVAACQRRCPTGSCESVGGPVLPVPVSDLLCLALWMFVVQLFGDLFTQLFVGPSFYGIFGMLLAWLYFMARDGADDGLDITDMMKGP